MYKWPKVPRLPQDVDMTYLYPKTKIHGTNGSIAFDGNVLSCHSRNNELTVNSDNVGFFNDYFVETFHLWAEALHVPCVVFGEWAGPGIMKGTAASLLSRKQFFIFGIYYPQCDTYTCDPEMISQILRIDIPDTHILPVMDYDTLPNMLQDSETCDRYFNDTFGVQGVGEGFVLYNLSGPVGKVVTPSFAKVSERKEKSNDPNKIVVRAELERYITPARVQQMLDEVSNGVVDMTKMLPYIIWMSKDVESELEELPEGVTWKMMSKFVPVLIKENL